MIQKYRKKPVVIDAVLLENNYKSIYWAVEFVHKIGMETSELLANKTVESVQCEGGIIINTLEGDMAARFGDYIIQGVAGEFYPCKSQIFKQTYEQVTPEAESTYLTRMMGEYKALDEKYQTLGDMLDRPQPNRINNTEWQALAEQYQHMKGYRQALGGRIKRASKIAA